MSEKVSIDQMASEINKAMEQYANASASQIKAAVRKTANSVRTEIKNNAPVNTGKYKAGWSTKVMKEDSQCLQMTVYNRNRYQIAHLLEKGHAKRGGGRVAARPHIAPAEQAGIKQLESLTKKALRG